MKTKTASRRTRASRPRVDGRTIARRTVMVLGLASALGFGGYATYETFGTDAPAQAYAAEVLDSITVPAVVADASRGEVVGRTAVTSIAPEVPSAAVAKAGQPFGAITSPLFGTQPLVKSDRTSAQATQDIIDSGVVAAYESRENPGEVGNFAVIGHRMTHGAVFSRVPELRKGDEVTVTTADGAFTYKVVREAFRVNPDEPSLLAPTAGEDPSILNWLGEEHEDKEDAALMTLITCGNWGTNHREVVVLELVPEA